MYLSKQGPELFQTVTIARKACVEQSTPMRLQSRFLMWHRAFLKTCLCSLVSFPWHLSLRFLSASHPCLSFSLSLSPPLVVQTVRLLMWRDVMCCVMSSHGATCCLGRCDVMCYALQCISLDIFCICISHVPIFLWDSLAASGWMPNYFWKYLTTIPWLTCATCRIQNLTRKMQWINQAKKCRAKEIVDITSG